MSPPPETIFALASAPGQAGLAVIRVSGPMAVKGFQALTCRPAPAPRQAVYGDFRNPADGGLADGGLADGGLADDGLADDGLIDRGIAVYFQSPQSYTGEDVVEYSLHGSRAVVSRFLEVLSGLENHRMAEPGEFTKRAFLNGKLDLTAAEAVADLIHAETEAQRVIALNQLGGALEGLYHGWADKLSRLLAHQEAEIEFPEEDMPTGIDDRVRSEILDLIDVVRAHLADGRKGERLRQGMQIAIIGAPNAGKSSLLNWLAQREAAIVSDIAGTTRDIVDVALNIGGYPAVISDTAGLRTAHSDAVEAEGIRRAIARAEDADLKIAVFDVTQPFDAATLDVMDERTLVVLNKTDLPQAPQTVLQKDVKDVAVAADGAPSRHALPAGCRLSLKTGAGTDDFLKALGARIGDFFHGSTEAPLLTRERHRQHLSQCVVALERALLADLPELAAEDLRQALRALGRMTGRVDVEQLLDIVFRDFCIGK